MSDSKAYLGTVKFEDLLNEHFADTTRTYTNTTPPHNKYYRIGYGVLQSDVKNVDPMFVCVVHWGRIGTNGQYTFHSFHTVAKMQAKVDSLIASKEAKGYKLQKTVKSKTSKGYSPITNSVLPSTGSKQPQDKRLTDIEF